MNYDDFNEGIPPYDMPFGDDKPNEPLNEGNDTEKIQADEVNSEDIQPIEIDDADVNIQEPQSYFVDEQPDYDNHGEPAGVFVDEIDLPGGEEEIFSPQEDEPYIEEPQENGHAQNKYILPAVILGAGIFAVCALFVIYRTELIPNLSFALGKKLHKAEKVEEVSGLPGDDAENANLGDENYQDLDIDMTKNRNKNKVVSIDDVDDLDMPPIPGSGNGMPNRNTDRDLLAGPNQNIPSGNTGRLDPFNPNGGDNQIFDVLVPPTNPTPDIEAQMLLTLKISGIMYTPDSPSAIINIAGSDQLVRKGDKFDGFSVEGISKDKVTVRNGKNIYTASVGETMNLKTVGVNAIPNLNRKFAGPYSKNKGRVIEINTIN